MKLSIHIIYDKIAYNGSYIITDENVHLNLCGVRYYSASLKLSEDLIYLIRPEQLHSVKSDKSLNFICLGDIGDRLINKKWSVIVLPSDYDPDSLFEKVQSIFEEYNQWINNINNSIFNGESMQSIFDKASIYLKNPVALFDNCQGLLMRTSNLNLDNLDPIWSYVINKGYSFKEIESDFLEEKIRKSHNPFYYNSPGKFRDIKRLIAPIKVRNYLFGVLAMTELTAPLSKSEYANLCIMQKIIENALKINDEFITSSETPWYMHRLITNKHVDYNIVSHHLSLRGKRVNDKYFLWYFSNFNNNKDYNIQHYYHYLAKLFESGITFYYENVILVCDYRLSNYDNEQFKNLILDFLWRTGINASISMIFNNIFEINYAFKQCQIANKYCNEENPHICSFNEVYFNYILSAIDKNAELDVFIAPQIRNLAPDNPYNQELLQTLQAFIINGKNVSTTAKALNIHRHTVVYRLSKIGEVTGINFEQLDEDTMFQLYLSCRILLSSSLS